MSPQNENDKDKSDKRKRNSRNSRKDYVGRSGVYPMSGPHPSGDAPLLGQMEWGQGEPGASGYEDHGSSELCIDSDVLVGDLDKDWVGAATFEAASNGEKVREIPVAEWPAFCGWFSRNFQAMETSIERRQGREQVAECRNRPLKAITAHVAANGVGEISVSVAAPPRERIFDVPGPTKMRMFCNAAGWPKHLEIDSAWGQVVLRFTREARTLPIFSKNSWGE